METILLEIADFFGKFSAAITKAVGEGNFADQLTYSGSIIAVVVAILGGIRALVKRLMRHDEKLHEEARDAKAEVARVEEEIARVRERNDALRGYDPDAFIRDMETIRREKVLGKLQTRPAEWLEPLRPALSVAYASLAREMVFEEPDRATLTRARHAAWGAVAARPVKENLDLLASVEEAWEADVMDSMPEHERAAPSPPLAARTSSP